MDISVFLADIGDRVRIERQARNMTQSEFAEKSGISSGTLKRMEQGRGTNFLHYILVCVTLDISPSQLLSNSWVPPKQIPTLAPKQIEILESLAEGGTLAEVARRLNMPTPSVASTLSRIYERLGVGYTYGMNRRAYAIKIARQYNLIKEESSGETDG